jgi:hypothetical protein
MQATCHVLAIMVIGDGGMWHISTWHISMWCVACDMSCGMSACGMTGQSGSLHTVLASRRQACAHTGMARPAGHHLCHA